MREGKKREEKRRGRREKGEERITLRRATVRCAVWLFGAVCLLVCLSVSASLCPLCSPVLSCAVLSCAVDNMSAVRSL